MTEVVTLSRVAKAVGVSKSTVSEVLRNRQGKVVVSEKTKQKIYATVKELNYHPLAAAKTLSTGKTMNLGFIISDKITGGLSNYYFSSIMSGFEQCCNGRGYRCIVGCHDLTASKHFVAPSKIRSKSVDGVVVCGYIENEIIETFVDSGIPFVLVGESADYPRDDILSVSEDMAQTWITLFKHLYEFGHRSICVGGADSKRSKGILNSAIEQFNSHHADQPLGIDINKPDRSFNQFEIAYKRGLNWVKEEKKPTAIAGHAYWCVGFLSAVLEAGYGCPRDLSVISTTDSPLCRWYHPAITAYSTTTKKIGNSLANLLIDYVEEKLNIVEVQKVISGVWRQGTLTIRKSVGLPFSQAETEK